MIDPTDPLAHLYAETGVPDDDDLVVPVRRTSLDALNAHQAPDDDVISDHDVDTLAALVASRRPISDAEAVDLGLGSMDPTTGELALNATGRRVFARLVDRMRGDQ